MAMAEMAPVSGARLNNETSAGEETTGDLELLADALLGDGGFQLEGIKLYTERRLLTKIAREFKRFPEARKEGLPAHVHEYLLNRHAKSVCDGAGLRGIRRMIFRLHLRGLSRGEIARRAGVSRQTVDASILAAARQVHLCRDRYIGLHEVYWQEVHRYIYRKPRS